MSSSKKTAPRVRKVQPPLLKRPRRKFTEEFKAEAVRMVEESGDQIGRIARELLNISKVTSDHLRRLSR